MPAVFNYNFEAEGHPIKVNFNTGLYINGKFVDGVNKTTIE
jgi:aldehyde dehydrogenase (NAD+)